MHIKILFYEFWKELKSYQWIFLGMGIYIFFNYFNTLWIGMSAIQVGISIILLTLWSAVVFFTPVFLVFLLLCPILIIKGITFNELNKFDNIFFPKLVICLYLFFYVVWMFVVSGSDGSYFEIMMDAICSLDSSCYRRH